MIRVLITSALIIVLNACSNQRWDPDDYPVTSGDTVYSIAWKYEIDPFELARWNGLSSPYTIYPGQRLNMNAQHGDAVSPASKPQATSTAKSRPDAITVREGDTLYALAKKHKVSAKTLA